MQRSAVTAAAAAVAAYCLYKARSKGKADAEEDEEDMMQVVDLSAFLKGGTDGCEQVARALHKHGFVIVRDPRVDHQDNDTFIDTMEAYYAQPEEDKAADIHPEVYYQVGATPSGVERARNHCSLVKSLGKDNQPVTVCPPGADPKWRFFRRMGELPPKTQFERLNAQPVIPGSGKFPDWEPTMDAWGNKILDTVRTVAEMSALGFDLPRDSFSSLMTYGPHLLAPTGSDLEEFGEKDTVFASFHYDLNFLTIHGKSRFPGLFAWNRAGKRFPVTMPQGCLLLQAGKQFEILTGGHVLAGFHEVVVSDATHATMAKRKAAGKSMWRVSSTLFSHIASDNTLMPLGHFATPQARKTYPAILAGHQVQKELELIALAKK